VGADPVQLFESACSLIVGTVDGEGFPEATRGWDVQLLAGGGRLRVVVSDDSGGTVRNLRGASARIAITATQVMTLESVQVKGRVVEVSSPSDDDLSRVERFCDRFFAAVAAADGVPIAHLRRMTPRRFATLVMTADEVFDQTPGPRAGTRLDALGART
jgi:hypothetical protein